jgi:hypothetical protein
MLFVACSRDAMYLENLRFNSPALPGTVRQDGVRQVQVSLHSAHYSPDVLSGARNSYVRLVS